MSLPCIVQCTGPLSKTFLVNRKCDPVLSGMSDGPTTMETINHVFRQR